MVIEEAPILAQSASDASGTRSNPYIRHGLSVCVDLSVECANFVGPEMREADRDVRFRLGLVTDFILRQDLL